MRLALISKPENKSAKGITRGKAKSKSLLEVEVKRRRPPSEVTQRELRVIIWTAQKICWIGQPSTVQQIRVRPVGIRIWKGA